LLSAKYSLLTATHGGRR